MKGVSKDHFPFLRLPKELRLMVYEFLPITRRHEVLDFPASGRGPEQDHENKDGKMTRIILVTKTLQLGMLQVCRLVHDEAKAIFAAKQSRLSKQAPQLILRVEDLQHSDTAKWVISSILLTIWRLLQNRDLDRTIAYEALTDRIGANLAIHMISEPSLRLVEMVVHHMHRLLRLAGVDRPDPPQSYQGWKVPPPTGLRVAIQTLQGNLSIQETGNVITFMMFINNLSAYLNMKSFFQLTPVTYEDPRSSHVDRAALVGKLANDKKQFGKMISYVREYRKDGVTEIDGLTPASEILEEETWAAEWAEGESI